MNYDDTQYLVEDHKLKKSMTEDRDDKKLHPLGTFSHGGVSLKRLSF